jgi:Ser/Thr protein kinase RdoA (MazF antagonist)
MRECFPTVNSTLSADALLTDVLPAFSIGPATSCRLLYIGVNDTYLVSTADGNRYVLRVYRAGLRTLENILFELDALLHLQKCGVPVSIPIPLRNGEFTYSVQAPEGKRYVALFTYAGGQELKYTDRAEAIRYGRTVAMLHEASNSLQSVHSRFTIDIEHLLISSLKTIEPFLASRSPDLEYLVRLADRLTGCLEALPLSRLEKGFCHGDLHGWNANIDDEGVVTFYDFDCCGTGWRAYDIAVFKWSSMLHGTEKDAWPAYLEGYRQCRNLSEIDLSAVRLFVPLRHIWTMGLNTLIAKFFGDSWVSSSYFDREIGFIRTYETEYLGGDRNNP